MFVVIRFFATFRPLSAVTIIDLKFKGLYVLTDRSISDATGSVNFPDASEAPHSGRLMALSMLVLVT